MAPIFIELTLVAAVSPDPGLWRTTLSAGKTKMPVIGAWMHKLIRVIYGIFQSKQPFDPDKLLPRSA
ncbi:MAG: hypothetical protein F6K00_02805 [Leptolyngbya sp. SIOISBB]|nr:hypothetical protein [Leptolyngbya sp. SIOISBB]